MNKRLMFFVLCGICTVTAKAQIMGFREPVVDFGVKVGGSFESLSSAPVKAGLGIVAGFYVQKNEGKFGIRLEATGSTAQYTTKYPAAYYATHTPGMDTVSTGNFQVVYINVPLMFEYSPNRKLHLLIGPQFSYVASITDKHTVYKAIYGNNDIITKTDFSIAAGAEYSINKKFQIGLRLAKGVLDVNNSTYYLVHKPWSSMGAQLSISYRIL